MKILVAPDSFKGAATNLQVAKAMEEGLLEGNPQLKIVTLPLADGGEGTLDVMDAVHKGTLHQLKVKDPLGRPVDAHYLTFENKAVVELAVASGLSVIETDERDPTQTNTFGTGQLIADAIGKGYKEIILSIGGSATNDAGTGIATALGFQFYDHHGLLIDPNGGNLESIHRIEPPASENMISFQMKVLCDVTNPFTGPEGAVMTYGMQKGAGHEDMEVMERGMVHFKDLVLKWMGIDLDTLPGAGAAGGVGGGMVAFFNAELVSGIEYLMKELKMVEKVQDCDLILTGEGSLDYQTLHGKTIGGLLKVAKEHGKPVVAFAGNVSLSGAEFRGAGLSAAFSIQPGVVDLPGAMRDTLKNVRDLASNLARILSI